MRTLPVSVLDSPGIQLDAYLELTDVDSATYVHSSDDISAISNLQWQIAFDGGLSKPNNYNISLSVNCLDTVKVLRQKYIRAETRLTMVVGSAGNTAQLHVGRVRNISVGEDDPFKLNLFILDKLFDDKPLFPKETMSDSYSTVHLEDLTAAQPIYYGKHHRPFYHTATDSSLATLLGPRNISSANHVSSVWFNSNFTEGNDINNPNLIIMEKSWEQQSGSSNLISGGDIFEVKDLDTLSGRLAKFNGSYGVSSNSTFDVASSNFREGNATADACFYTSEMSGNNPSAGPGFFNFWATPYIERVIPQEILKTNHVNFAFLANNPAANGISARLAVSSGAGLILQTLFSIIGNTTTGSAGTDASGQLLLTEGGKKSFIFFTNVVSTSTAPSRTFTATMSLQLAASLKSEGYKKYSIMSPVVSSADIAISANPFGIFDDIASNHLGLQYHQDQSSQTQVDVQSYELQMFLDDRIPVTDILDEIGRISDVSIWAADSGMLKLKTYQESATATSSINQTITLCNMYPKTFRIEDAPLGTTVTGQQLFSEIRLGSKWDFQLGQYKENNVASKLNNNLCNSMFNSGINKTLSITTEYITDPNVASYYLGKLVRKHCQGTDIVTFEGGPSLLNIELADVLKIQHPMIVGSESLYQVIKSDLNVMKGSMKVTAAKLVEQG